MNVARIRLTGPLAGTINPADPEILSLFEQGVKSFVRECPELALISFGENLPWIAIDPKTGKFVASILVADSPKTDSSTYQEKMQTTLPSFVISEFSYESHLFTALEEDELLHRKGEILNYLKNKGRTVSFQVAHDLKIDRETCDSLLSHLLRTGKIEKEGEYWNNAVFFVPG